MKKAEIFCKWEMGKRNENGANFASWLYVIQIPKVLDTNGYTSNTVQLLVNKSLLYPKFLLLRGFKLKDK